MKQKEYRVDLVEIGYLDSDEIRSLLKSNVISWEERRWIKIVLANKVIEEYTSLIMLVGVASVVMEIVSSLKTSDSKKESDL